MPRGDARPAQPGVVWLVGMMAAGKSAVGRRLAERLGRSFVDLDEVVEREAGATVRELFAAEGEAGFRAREAAAVAALAAAGRDAVVATGGGSFVDAELARAMDAAGLPVWLDVEAQEVGDHLGDHRPLLGAGAADPRVRLALWRAVAAERRPAYARAPVRVARLGRGADEVADEIGALLRDYGDAPLAAPPVTARVDVDVASGGYPILIDGADDARAAERFAAHLARRAPPGRAPIGLVTDDNVARLHGDRYLAALQQRGFRAVPVIVPAGERSKSLAQVESACEALAAGGLDRRSTVVALGGGVVGDLAGLVASLLLRGVGFAQVPTTLLAQVDASVGGKTGVDLAAGKNLVGTFHAPRCVFVDLGALATLPARERSSGLAEVAKHALLDGEAPLARLEADAARARAGDPALLAELIAASCTLKARVVGADEREERPDGGRALLNLGHTVGHALEAESLARDADPLRHGEAVALGLVAASRVSDRLASARAPRDATPALLATAPGEPRREAAAPSVGASTGEPARDAAARAVDGPLEVRVTALLTRLGLPTDLDRRLAPAVLDRLAVDKKRHGGAIRFITLDRPGAARLVPLTPDRIAELLGAPGRTPAAPPRRSLP